MTRFAEKVYPWLFIKQQIFTVLCQNHCCVNSPLVFCYRDQLMFFPGSRWIIRNQYVKLIYCTFLVINEYQAIHFLSFKVFFFVIINQTLLHLFMQMTQLSIAHQLTRTKWRRRLAAKDLTEMTYKFCRTFCQL